jgi:hypothetical protein
MTVWIQEERLTALRAKNLIQSLIDFSLAEGSINEPPNKDANLSPLESIERLLNEGKIGGETHLPAIRTW